MVLDAVISGDSRPRNRAVTANGTHLFGYKNALLPRSAKLLTPLNWGTWCGQASEGTPRELGPRHNAGHRGNGTMNAVLGNASIIRQRPATC